MIFVSRLSNPDTAFGSISENHDAKAAAIFGAFSTSQDKAMPPNSASLPKSCTNKSPAMLKSGWRFSQSFGNSSVNASQSLGNAPVNIFLKASPIFGAASVIFDQSCPRNSPNLPINSPKSNPLLKLSTQATAASANMTLRSARAVIISATKSGKRFNRTGTHCMSPSNTASKILPAEANKAGNICIRLSIIDEIRVGSMPTITGKACVNP